jgi:chemotaxis protein methyltransferase CheR
VSTAPVRSAGSFAGKSSLVDGEFVLTESDFRDIAAMLHGDAGISLPDSKATLVYSRLAKRLRALGLSSFRDYCELVSGKEGVDERQKMLAALTTNVTRFFREPHHFEHLRTVVLPPLIDAARRGERVRLWSAACSTGPEPYSTAMTVLQAMPDAGRYDLKILATDIDPNVVAEARRGVYSNDAAAPVPGDLRQRWMSRTDGGWRMGDDARSLVTFNELNLIGQWPMRGHFDVIFCRNVVIYFEDDTQSRVWTRLGQMLRPGGYLYIGHSERVIGPAAGQLALQGTTTYRLTGEIK